MVTAMSDRVVVAQVEVPFQDASLGMINLLFGGIVSGEVGYNAYCDAVGWRAYNGDLLPQWADLPDRIRSAWDDASYAIVEAAARIGGTRERPDGCVCGHMETRCAVGWSSRPGR